MIKLGMKKAGITEVKKVKDKEEYNGAFGYNKVSNEQKD